MAVKEFSIVARFNGTCGFCGGRTVKNHDLVTKRGEVWGHFECPAVPDIAPELPTQSFETIVRWMDTVRTHLKWPKAHFAVAGTNLFLARDSKGQVQINGEEMVYNRRFGKDMHRWYGRIGTDGTLTRSGEMTLAIEAALVLWNDDPAGEAAAYGKLTGRCCFCHLPLTDERSTEVGYGKICAAHYGLPWGE